MRMQIPRVEAIALISRIRACVCDQDQLDELMQDWQAPTVFEALVEAYAAVTNGFLSQVCEAITGRTLEVVGEAASRFPCPCCGRRTLCEVFCSAEGSGFDVCDHCGWEDDGTKDDEVVSSVNRGSMAEYRARMRDESNYFMREKWSPS